MWVFGWKHNSHQNCAATAPERERERHGSANIQGLLALFSSGMEWEGIVHLHLSGMVENVCFFFGMCV